MANETEGKQRERENAKAESAVWWPYCAILKSFQQQLFYFTTYIFIINIIYLHHNKIFTYILYVYDNMRQSEIINKKYGVVACL